MRGDLRRIWRQEGPLGSAATRIARAAGVSNAGRELTVTDQGAGGEDDLGGSHDGQPASSSSRLSPQERDARKAGVGRRHRMSLVPKRNIALCLWTACWNAQQAATLSLRAVPAFIGAEMHSRGAATGVPIGLVKAVGVGTQYLLLGAIVSPALLVLGGLYNTLRGARNVYVGDMYFDMESGRYKRFDYLKNRQRYGTSPDRVIGRLIEPFTADYRVAKREQNEWLKTPAGRTVETMKGLFVRRKNKKQGGTADAKGKTSGEKTASEAFGMEEVNRVDAADHYEVLQVQPTATQTEIKASYGRLAKVFHPDVNKSPDARRTFEELTTAYKILSDPKAREAYDVGGHRSAEVAAAMADQRRGGGPKGKGPRPRLVGGLATAKDGRIMGTPAEVAQSMYGGLPFSDLVVGPLFRSPLHFGTSSQARVGMSDYESLQVCRMLRLVAVLVPMLDASAMDELALTAVRAAAAAGVSAQAAAIVADMEAAAAEAVAQRDAAAQKALAAGAQKSRGGAVASSSPNVIAAEASKAKAQEAAATSSSTSASSNATGGAKDKSKPDALAAVSKEYAARCDRFAARLAKCCFGPELMYEVGHAYVAGASRYLGEIPFYAPKRLTQKKLFGGYERFWGALKGELSESGMGQDTAYNIFAMEFDNVIADTHAVVRFVCISAAGDTSIPDVVELELRRQCQAKETSSPKSMAKDTSGNAGPTVEVSEGFHVALPTGRLSQGTPSQQAAVKAEMLRLLAELSPRDKARWLDAVAVVIRTRRLLALRALGKTYVLRGRPFGFRNMDECTTHFRSVVNSHENTSLPPIF
jgi:hypothetical protein